MAIAGESKAVANGFKEQTWPLSLPLEGKGDLQNPLSPWGRGLG